MALRLFEIEKGALEGAIAGAPEILFVAGAGNEDNSSDFAQYIPAGVTLTDVQVDGDVLVADADVDGAIVTDPSLQANGTCD